jgi:hypothetical protein
VTPAARLCSWPSRCCGARPSGAVRWPPARSRGAAGAQTAVLVFFRLIVLAPTFLPRDQLQGRLETASAANPTTYVLEARRSNAIDGWDAGTLLAGFGVVGALCGLSLLWATRVAGRITARPGRITARR